MIILNYFHCLLSTAKLFFWLILISSLAGKRLAALLAKFAVLLRRHADIFAERAVKTATRTKACRQGNIENAFIGIAQ